MIRASTRIARLCSYADDIQIGTLVYARVSISTRDMEPELECFDASTGKAEGFGELKGGLIIGCTLQLCRQFVAKHTLRTMKTNPESRLLNPKYPVLSALSAHIPFELAIGLNGRIWLKAPNVNQTIALKRIIESVDNGEIRPEKSDVERAVKALL
jgi:exosome complex component RRP40